jgi:hypothetical protein
MLNARRSTKGGGVADIGDTTALNNLRLKYPRGAPTHLTVCIEDSTSLAAHIMGSFHEPYRTFQRSLSRYPSTESRCYPFNHGFM